MKIKPWGNKIQLNFPTTKVGAIKVPEGSSILERGVVMAVGPECGKEVKTGDVLLVKAWDIDVITIQDEKFYFVSADSRAICAKA